MLILSRRTYGQRVGEVRMPKFGDELHHFGWNACSSALCPYAPHPHVERRYLVVPGIRSSRIHIIDTKPDPRKPQIVKVIEPEEVFARTNYSRPHTIHCGPEAIYVSALGASQRRRPGRHFHARLRDVRNPGPVGSRPRRVNFCIMIFGGIWDSTRCSAANGARRT